MGMSSGVVFLRSKDNEQYQKMVKVAQACTDAGVALPEEVDKYFDGEFEYNPEAPLEVSARGIAKEYRAEMVDGFDIHIKDIPEGVEIIRFYNSY